MHKRGELYLDFEFNKIVEQFVNLVCCTTFDPVTNTVKEFWLHRDLKNQAALVNHLQEYDTFITYAAIAECRSFLSLGLLPLGFEWVDLFIEYRCITNHNDRMQWGEQLVDGRVKIVRKPKPKWERTEEDGQTGFSATHSLAEATFKLTKQIRDTQHKTAMRDLIISEPKDFSPRERRDIQKYCTDDVVFLPEIRAKIEEEFFTLDPNLTRDQLLEEQKVRGRYAAHTAIMESRGYPFNKEKTKNFSKSVSNIIYDTQKEINELFPEIKPFRWNRAEQKYSWNQKATKEWIKANHDESKWKKTDGGKKKIPDLALSLEAFERFYAFKHDYPKDNFGAQMVRFLKLKQSVYGFVPASGKDKKTFWDFVGSDGRVRPYMNIFKAQSSRSQPGATGFIFLKPAWMRVLVEPQPGNYIAGIDYGSEEFFASALISGDVNMIKAYLSGDPYLALAKLAGAVPLDATKESHKAMRDLFKNTTLGISYLMSKWGLAIKLTNDMGRPWTEEQAQEQIDIFYKAFWQLKEYQDWIPEQYAEDGFIKLPCGWYMWGDNPNFRSVSNVPIQGFGGSVMRKAVDIAVTKYGLNVIMTLHDALYIEQKVGEEYKIALLRDAMREAFVFYLDENLKSIGRKIRLDPFAWSPSYEKDSVIYVGKHKWEVPCSNLYIDDRAQAEYDKFKEYFEPRVEDLV